ncbi:hypothetical protein HII36_42430 [Nonomuraea sp. NN258]|uniref:conjugal transfer protein TrbL family protein n=1 Tax=Nonomuraea antri TaxID=2730852 RepID=UPI001C2C4A35|nr:conjugal transfer protein TrbL family protein [Nonomuraea antri]NRQ38441.1 hypothetical protein [Nonomuraea antri]
MTWISPTQQPSPSTEPSTGVHECGWLDVGCKLNQAMNGWFTHVVTHAIKPAFVMVGSVLLAAPPPLMLERVRELTGHVRLVANALLVLMVLAGGVIVMAYGSAQTSTTPGEVIPRLVVAVITLNASLTICQFAIDLVNSMVTALLGDGIDGQRAGNLIADKVDSAIKDLEGTALFLVLLAGVAVLMGILLAFIGVIRVTLLLFLIIAAPLALLCHALPQTEGIAKLWWRCFSGLLAIQILQALALILAFKLVLTDSADAFPLAPADPGVGDALEAIVRPTASRALDVLILIGVLFVLIKIPGWVARTIWQQGQPHMLKRLIKAVIVYKTLGAARTLGKAGHRATRRKAATAASQHRRRPPGSGPRGPRPGPNRPGPSATAPGASPMPSNAPAWQQLQLPLGLPPTATTTSASAPGTSSAAARRARVGTQLALPFPVTRVPRPPAPPRTSPASGPWIRPRPPWVQDRLPGMPTRAPRPGQLRLRLDPPPRRIPRAQRRGGTA